MEMPMLPPLPLSPTTDPSGLASQAGSKNPHAHAGVGAGFESMLASLLVKELRQSLEPDTLFGEDRGEVLGGLFDFYMGQHLAQANPFGIGAAIEKQIEARRTR